MNPQPPLVNLSLQSLLQAENLSQGDLKEIATFVTGTSVVDWSRLHLETVPAVNEFLRVNGFNPNNLDDRERVAAIHQAAVEYLISEFKVRLPAPLLNPERIQQVFLIASGNSTMQRKACMLLKVMLVINHMEARKLLYRLTVSERMLFKEVETKVEAAVENMKDLGFPIEDFAKSRKTRKSIITKILTKEKNTAAQVFDRVRFRIVMKEPKDIIPAMYYLKKKLIPFNYVIPGESRNNLLTRETIFPQPADGEVKGLDDAAKLALFENEFTHPEYKVLSFVADIPLRIDRLLGDIDDASTLKLGNLVFIPAEFQLYDAVTWQNNESGPASHELYKERQKDQVWGRLLANPGAKFGDADDNDPEDPDDTPKR
jgi:uncharacterized protein (TIGR04552 family)